MSNINNNLNVRRPIANITVEDIHTTRESWSQCSAEQQRAQEAFEQALNCVESNAAKRGRNQRDWDEPCTMMDAVAVAHGAFWGGVSAGAVTAATASAIPVSAVMGAAVGAAVGFGQAVTDPDNTTSINPAHHFSENPLQPESNKGLDSQ
jgi:hypothetical protein